MTILEAFCTVFNDRKAERKIIISYNTLKIKIIQERRGIIGKPALNREREGMTDFAAVFLRQDSIIQGSYLASGDTILAYTGTCRARHSGLVSSGSSFRVFLPFGRCTRAASCKEMLKKQEKEQEKV